MVSFDTSIYTPGFGISGRDGKKGLPGKNGKALFFVPYDLRLGNNVDMALYRIKNNISFDDSTVSLPEDRPYQNNDEFVDINGNVYKVNEDKTDFEYISTLKPASSTDDANINLVNDVSINGTTLTCTVDTSTYDVWSCQRRYGTQGRYFYTSWQKLSTASANITIATNVKEILLTFSDKNTKETFTYEINIPS